MLRDLDAPADLDPMPHPVGDALRALEALVVLAAAVWFLVETGAIGWELPQ